jgi:hypothetical protein
MLILAIKQSTSPLSPILLHSPRFFREFSALVATVSFLFQVSFQK